MKLHQLYAHLAQAKADSDTALIARQQDAISGRIDAIAEYPQQDGHAHQRERAALAELERAYPQLFGVSL